MDPFGCIVADSFLCLPLDVRSGRRAAWPLYVNLEAPVAQSQRSERLCLVSRRVTSRFVLGDECRDFASQAALWCFPRQLQTVSGSEKSPTHVPEAAGGQNAIARARLAANLQLVGLVPTGGVLLAIAAGLVNEFIARYRNLSAFCWCPAKSKWLASNRWRTRRKSIRPSTIGNFQASRNLEKRFARNFFEQES
jgi:hypothetical protein